ncbi:RNA polymerase sigma factor [Plantactinospora sp. KLBMP9567]|uniref:RNA polymerase sigma factor n=1 Tax=Plantactinospora sp. KLBMP9567 TaxID=3085900 RepID=UPI0029824A74|nr:RNA polymerase sigma factor [Plantactinospora sp. KLBMP9567]MDW5323169.1 RNA polymerase sigma factor [Plantactinospora sp. KLBMP9567]
MRTDIPPSDTQLWTAGTDGDETAFGQLFERHARAVYNHAFRLSGSWSVAEDATQTTFVTAWRRRGEARLVDGSVLPWLLVVATNATRTEHRSRRRWHALLRRIPPEPEGTSDPADEVADRLHDEQRMRDLLALVRKLPRAEREAIALCVWSGVPYAQAATILGVTEGAVRSRVSRARARLARMVATRRQEER